MPIELLGTVGGERFVIEGFVDEDASSLRKLWSGALKAIVRGGIDG